MSCTPTSTPNSGTDESSWMGESARAEVPEMAEITYREALNEALREEMERDPDVFLMGEEVAEYDGAYKVSKGLLDVFGDRRIVDSPISELGFAGLGVGAAMAGLKPVIEFMTFNFSILALDQVINHAAKIRYMSGGQIPCSIVFRGPNGAALQLSAQHSQACETYYVHAPGVKVVTPATPADAKGLLKAAIRDPDPVAFMEAEMLYNVKGEVPDDDDFVIPLGVADVKREGTDVTILTHGKTVHVALQAAQKLDKDGVSVEVVDLRSIRPLDVDTILASVKKTNRAVYLEEGWAFAGVGAQIVSMVQEEAFDWLDAPVVRVMQADVPMPYAKNLEQMAKPSAERVVAACNRVLYR
ncbi:pyruvate dehydrogenase complex E1 component subunit beta [Gemmatimonadota bacterium DH-20]|uniref:Pyruvate dehydrogenase complex E1 component subunit beta n=2 Tax=Gaopeijia maritima TaxID=3119007 RepID=A0ABU9E4X8_9BACT